MSDRVMLITGTRKGIGRYLSEYYLAKGFRVIGCSRQPVDFQAVAYEHFCLDITDEGKVTEMLAEIRKRHGRLDVLINNAAIASMNHSLLTPIKTVEAILRTNYVATFQLCCEAAKLMRKSACGRIVNFATVAVPLRLAGEAAYAASKAAVITLTHILAKEFAAYNITVNAVGPAPIKTDLIKAVPEDKLVAIVNLQAIRRFGECRDVANVVDFFIRPESDFITGQVLFLGGI